jgi:hypothetical protein
LHFKNGWLNHVPLFIYELLLSQELKKFLLVISVLLCLCKAFAGGAIFQKQAAVSPFQNGLYSLAAVNYPHTEFDIHYQNVSTSNNCRQQNLHSFTATAESIQYYSQQLFANTTEPFKQVWCKQYLSHIYPTHNFW